MSHAEPGRSTTSHAVRVAVLRAGWLPTDQANGVQTVKMCEAFARIGLRVDLHYIPARMPTHELSARVVFHDDVQLHPVPRAVLPLSKRFALQGPFDLPGFAHAWAWSYLAARRARRWRPLFAFVRDPILAHWTARLRIPTVLEIHTLPTGAMARVVRTVVSSHEVVGVVAVTGLLADDLEGAGLVTEDKLSVLHDGVDYEAFALDTEPGEMRSRFGLSMSAPLILYAGSGMPNRGLDVFVAAARYAPEYGFLALGPKAKHVEQLRSDAPDNVHFAPRVPHSDVPQFLAAADVLVLPMRREVHTARYASPMKLFEYMAAAQPIVATNLPAVREVLEHGTTGWLVEPDSPAALAAGIRTLVDDRALAGSLASSARREARRYRWEDRATRIAEVVARRSAA